MGAALGFLWFNAHPAEIFMGDVGSLSMGGALGTVAVITKAGNLLAIVGGFCDGDVFRHFQVGYFKLTGGKRIFRMAPIHHHFELKGLGGAGKSLSGSGSFRSCWRFWRSAH